MGKQASRISECRVCGNQDLRLVFDAGVQTLTGRFPASVDERISSGPLELLQCNPGEGCGLVQLGHTYDLDEMYGETYGYRSGLNKAMVRHLQGKVDAILAVAGLQAGDLVIDIGSNDGTTLNAYPPNKYDLVGVDPASHKFRQYYNDGIRRIPDFFSKSTIREQLSDRKAKVVTSFSMFYDLEDPVQFAKDVESVLASDGMWFLEQSYLPTMLEANSFDTICHEHLEFYSLHSIQTILDKAGLRVVDVEFNDVNGGSFSVSACKKASGRASNTDRIEAILRNESTLGLQDGSAFERFGARVSTERDKLMSFLEEQKQSGKRVSCLGASTKGNVLLQYYGITTALVDVIGEVNPDKFGCFSPGTHIPIVPQDELLAANPDYLLVLPWHFRDFFVALPALQGRSIVFPLPEFEIIDL